MCRSNVSHAHTAFQNWGGKVGIKNITKNIQEQIVLFRSVHVNLFLHRLNMVAFFAAIFKLLAHPDIHKIMGMYGHGETYYLKTLPLAAS